MRASTNMDCAISTNESAPPPYSEPAVDAQARMRIILIPETMSSSLSGPRRVIPTGVGALRPAATQRLDLAVTGRPYAVGRVIADPRVPERDRQLQEIGFHAGEHVMVMTRGFPGGDPLVVRIGQSTFALRRDEAACVEIEALPDRSGR